MEATLKQARKNKNYCMYLNSIFTVLGFVVAVTLFLELKDVMLSWSSSGTSSAVYKNLVSCDLSSLRRHPEIFLETERRGLTFSKFTYFL